MRKKGLPKIIAIAVTSLYCGAQTKVRVGSKLFEELLLQVGVHQESVLLLLFAIVMDVVTENAIEGLINENLYAYDLVLISESM